MFCLDLLPALTSVCETHTCALGREGCVRGTLSWLPLTHPYQTAGAPVQPSPPLATAQRSPPQEDSTAAPFVPAAHFLSKKAIPAASWRPSQPDTCGTTTTPDRKQR